MMPHRNIYNNENEISNRVKQTWSELCNGFGIAMHLIWHKKEKGMI